MGLLYNYWSSQARLGAANLRLDVASGQGASQVRHDDVPTDMFVLTSVICGGR